MERETLLNENYIRFYTDHKVYAAVISQTTMFNNQ